MCESYQTVENIAIEVLLKFKQESSTSGPNRLQKPQLDATYFLEERMQRLKNCSELWTKGLDDINEPSMFRCTQPNQGQQNEILLTKPSCPRSILDPTLRRPPITLKMMKLVDLYEKREKFYNKS